MAMLENGFDGITRSVVVASIVCRDAEKLERELEGFKSI